MKALVSALLLVSFFSCGQTIDTLQETQKHVIFIKSQLTQSKADLDGLTQVDSQYQAIKNEVQQLQQELEFALAQHNVQFNQFVDIKTKDQYQQYLNPQQVTVTISHQCDKMDSAKECESNAKLLALEEAAKQGAQVQIQHAATIYSQRNDVNGQSTNKLNFEESTQLSSKANVVNHQILKSQSIDNSITNDKNWLIELSATVTAQDNADIYQTMLAKNKQQWQHLMVFESANAPDNSQQVQLNGDFTLVVDGVVLNMVHVDVPGQAEYYLAQTETTKQLYQLCISQGACNKKVLDAFSENPLHPVVNVSWNEINQQFLPWLNEKTAKQFRLPTLNEWQNAAQIYLTSDKDLCLYGNTADASLANQRLVSNPVCNDGFAKTTSPVKHFAANELGFYDLIGNVAEWTLDCTKKHIYKGCFRVAVAGSSWYDKASANGIDMVQGRPRSAKLDTLGFRLALDGDVNALKLANSN